MAEPNITKIEPMNLAENLTKNVKFNELANNMLNGKQPNFTPEQIQIAQQMSNIMQQHLKQPPMQTPQMQAPPMQAPPMQIPKGILKEPMSHTVDTTVPIAENIITATSGDYFSLFGFQLSKMTVYIIIALILFIVVYFIYSKWFSGPKEEKKKKKKQNEVSYQEQEKINQED